jgi:drug/metabolite transporter (DMT)-like permease
MLWATDSLFRVPALASLDPVFIVLCEHLVGVLFLSPWPIIPALTGFFKLRLSQVLGLFLVGAGGSALATVLFTASFREVHPSVAILLQKLQPVLVLFLASVFLSEKLNSRFLKWALIALTSGFVLSFPDMDFSFLGETGLTSQSKGVLLALGAATLWAASTVVGKALLADISPAQMTGWRYLFGLIALSVYLFQSGGNWDWDILWSDRIALRAVIFTSLISGLFAMVIYYQGLARTRATLATLMELLFPVSAIGLNAWVLNRPLTPVQLAASLVLLIAVTRISLLPPLPSRK